MDVTRLQISVCHSPFKLSTTPSNLTADYTRIFTGLHCSKRSEVDSETSFRRIWACRLTSMPDYFYKTHNVVLESLQIRAYKALRKSYDFSSATYMLGLLPQEIQLRLKAGCMSKSSMWVEHSTGTFDYRHFQATAPPLLYAYYPTLRVCFLPLNYGERSCQICTTTN